MELGTLIAAGEADEDELGIGVAAPLEGDVDDVAPTEPAMGSDKARGPVEGTLVAEAPAGVAGTDESCLTLTGVTGGLGEVAEFLTGVTPPEAFTMKGKNTSSSEGVGGVKDLSDGGGVDNAGGRQL